MNVWTEGALTSSDLTIAGGVTENKLVQLGSSDLSWCRDWSENAAWGRDWYSVHLLQIHGAIVWSAGCGPGGYDGDGWLLGGGSPQLVHV